LVTRGQALTKRNGSYAIGVGVEDPTFVGRRSGSGKGELKRWVPILSEFHTVFRAWTPQRATTGRRRTERPRIRRSRTTATRPDVTAQDGLIGLNLGFGDDLWGQDPAHVAEQIAGAAKATGHPKATASSEY